MSAAFVVDSSVALTWLFVDEVTPKTDALFDRLATESALVPSLWFLEITNSLAIAERKGRVTRAQTDGFLSRMEHLNVQAETDIPTRAFDQILPLCRQYRLTSYDAIYLELALRQNLPLATLDSDLRKVAKGLGVTLLGM
jgi:predicted nucleic acid-binding protein